MKATIYNEVSGKPRYFHRYSLMRFSCKAVKFVEAKMMRLFGNAGYSCRRRLRRDIRRAAGKSVRFYG